ncbi:MAG: clostripain-related cysteine peptidase [Hydrogeniiclostridium mannosilyticum]
MGSRQRQHRGRASDENYGFDALTLAEMDDALETVSEQMTDRFELFGFDACLMATSNGLHAEAYARYLLASEEIEPSGGWDYGVLFGAISADKSISGGARASGLRRLC